MAANRKLLIRVFSPRVIARAIATLDKSTALIVSAAWLAALVTLILAVFAVHGAVSSQKEAMDARISEPALPQATTTPIAQRDTQTIIDRLQHQFPDIKFDIAPGQAISVKSPDGSKFHQWITALGYIDTMAPEYRWTLSEFCVGACSNQDLMRATVTGQRVVFSLPQH
jgi:hypothetical protein